MAITGDPIRLGLVSSLAHPGGNITGVSVDAGIDIFAKRVELLAEAGPKLRKLLLVASEQTWDGATGKASRQAAQQLGISLSNALVSTPRTGVPTHLCDDKT